MKGLALLWLATLHAAAVELDALIADRAAVERVYYSHRLGIKPAFEETLPAAELRRLVELDLAKEAALKRAYGIEIAPAEIEAEVTRIERTTRDAVMLAEIKTALGNDRARFARTVVRPILVEKALRERFQNDDAIHAPQRAQATQLRERLLAARTNGVSAAELVMQMKASTNGAFHEFLWSLNAPAPPPPTNATGSGFVGSGSEESPPTSALQTVPSRQVTASRFDGLPAELQAVLRAQLRQPGDVSAVIETPGGFVVYLLQERTPEALHAASSFIAKRALEEWLAMQARLSSPSAVQR